jgi:transcription elongation factor GreA
VTEVDPNAITREGLERLRAEVEELETTGRREGAERIRIAREWGDLKENAEYHAAKDAQAHLETRILRLREQIDNANVVEAQQGGDIVAFGATVEVEDEQSAARSSYRLVAQHEAAPAEGRLSFDSPVGAALRGKRVGDVAVVETPRGGRRLRVLSIR